MNYTSGLKAILGNEWSSNPDDPGWDPQEQGISTATDNTLVFDGRAIHNPYGKVIWVYAMNGACLGSSSREIIAVDHLPVGTYVAVSKDGAIRFARF